MDRIDPLGRADVLEVATIERAVLAISALLRRPGRISSLLLNRYILDLQVCEAIYHNDPIALVETRDSALDCQNYKALQSSRATEFKAQDLTLTARLLGCERCLALGEALGYNRWRNAIVPLGTLWHRPGHMTPDLEAALKISTGILPVLDRLYTIVACVGRKNCLDLCQAGIGVRILIKRLLVCAT